MVNKFSLLFASTKQYCLVPLIDPAIIKDEMTRFGGGWRKGFNCEMGMTVVSRQCLAGFGFDIKLWLVRVSATAGDLGWW